MKKRRPDREDFLEAELSLALLGTACPVCVLSGETEQAVLAWLSTTTIRQEATIAKLIEARGLCAPHWASLLGRRGGDLGSSGAGLLSEIADAAVSDLGAGTVEDSAPCPVCRSVKRRERSVLGMLFASLAGPHGATVLRPSAGLCRPHLAVAIELNPEAAILRTLIAAQRRSLTTLADHARASANDAEERATATRRIIAMLAGARSAGA